MWRQILIFVPLVAALLDILNVLSTAFGRIVVLAVLIVGVFASWDVPPLSLVPSW